MQSRRPTTQSSPDLFDVWDLFVLHFDQSASGTAAAPPDGFLVSGDVEADEQDEVRAQDAHSGESGEFLTGAGTRGGEPGEVAGGEVGVGGEVDETQVDDELDDLQHGDVFLPPDFDPSRGLEVVPVHDHVDGQVEYDGHPGHGSVADKLGEAEESGGAVVVGVEEGKRFLLEEEEDGVDEFEVFGEVVELKEEGFLSAWAAFYT